MTTDNHNLNTPPRGEEDWDAPLNENFEIIDKRLQRKVVAPEEGSDGIIDAVEDLGEYGGVIHLRPGVYEIEDTIDLKAGQELRGAGINVTRLRPTLEFHENASNSNDAVITGSNGGEWRERTYDGRSGLNRRIRVSDLEIEMIPEELEEEDTDDDPVETYPGIFLHIAYDCWIDSVRVLNAGGADRGEGAIMVKSAGHTNADLSAVTNCETYRTGDIAIDVGSGGWDGRFCMASGNRIINPLDARSTGSFGEPHGIVFEDVHSSVISDNIVIDAYWDDDDEEWVPNETFEPAINMNLTSNSTCSGNHIYGAYSGIRIGQQNAHRNTVTGNTFLDCGTGLTLTGGQDDGHANHNTVVGNTFERDRIDEMRGINVSGRSHADIQGNAFYNMNDHGIRCSSGMSDPTIITGNRFHRSNDESAVNIADDGGVENGEYHIITNNYFDDTDGPRSCSTRRAIVTGNYFGHVDNFENESITARGGIIMNNVFRGGIRGGGDIDPPEEGGNPTWIENNWFGEDMKRFGPHAVFKNNKVHELLADKGQLKIEFRESELSDRGFDTEIEEYTVGEPREATYTGDGEESRQFPLLMYADHVIVQHEDSGQTFDVHQTFGAGFQHDGPDGTLELTKWGFEVGDSGNDEHPNQDGETYTFWAK